MKHYPNDYSIPKYNHNADYNTNTQSFADYLAKSNEFLKILSKRIWEYDKEMAKRLLEWDEKIDEMPEEMRLMFIDWLDEGIIADIINHDVLNRKAEIVVSEFEPIPSNENMYWYKDVGKSGLQAVENIIQTNVAVGHDIPQEDDKNVWLQT